MSFGLGAGQLVESNGRVNFSSSSSEYSYIARPWSANQASYVRDWEVQLDTMISADSGLDQFAGVGLEIWNSANSDMYVGIEHDNQGRSPQFYSYATTPLGVRLADASTRSAMVSGAIRIAFDSRAKILTTYCDPDGAANGYQWMKIGSYGVAGYGGATDNSNWKMNDSSSFTVAIVGVSSGTSIPAAQFHMDHLVAITRPAGPEVKLRGTDNFNDTSKDATKWGNDTNFSFEPGELDESGGRVNFSSSSTEYSYIARHWRAQRGSYEGNREIQLDTTIPQNSGLDQFAAVGLEIWNSGNTDMYVGIQHDNDGQSPRYYTYGTTATGANLPVASTPTALVSGAIRVVFDSTAKVLTTYGDPDGAANGYQWTMIASYGVAGSGGATGNADWGMGASSGFTVAVFGASSGTAVPKGQVYADNFVAISETPEFEATVIFSEPRAGSIFVFSKVGKSYRLFRSEDLNGQGTGSAPQAGTGGGMSFSFDDSASPNPGAFFQVQESNSGFQP